MDWPSNPVEGQVAFGPIDRQWQWTYDGAGWRRTRNGLVQINAANTLAALPETVSDTWAPINYV